MLNRSLMLVCLLLGCSRQVVLGELDAHVDGSPDVGHFDAQSDAAQDALQDTGLDGTDTGLDDTGLDDTGLDDASSDGGADGALDSCAPGLITCLSGCCAQFSQVSPVTVDLLASDFSVTIANNAIELAYVSSDAPADPADSLHSTRRTLSGGSWQSPQRLARVDSIFDVQSATLATGEVVLVYSWDLEGDQQTHWFLRDGDQWSPAATLNTTALGGHLDVASVADGFLVAAESRVIRQTTPSGPTSLFENVWGRWPQIAVLPSGRGVVANQYQVNAEPTRVAVYQEGASSYSMGSYPAGFSSVEDLQVDSAGGLHLIGRFNATGRYAYRSPQGQWSPHRQLSDFWSEASLVVDSEGRAHIFATNQQRHLVHYHQTGVGPLADWQEAVVYEGPTPLIEVSAAISPADEIVVVSRERYSGITSPPSLMFAWLIR